MMRIRRTLLAALLATLVPLALQAQAIEGADPSPSSPAASQAPDGSASVTRPDPSGQAPATVATQPAYVLPGSRKLDSLLGMTLKEAFGQFGPPEEVFSVRGQQAWEDDVVFYYPDHTYLFWFKNRVWQVRADRRYSSEVLGVRMGESRSAVEAALGAPFWSDSDSDIFNIHDLSDRGFPIRARLFFTDGNLSDLYIYRGDF